MGRVGISCKNVSVLLYLGRILPQASNGWNENYNVYRRDKSYLELGGDFGIIVFSCAERRKFTRMFRNNVSV